jgi:hypothetical protein
MVKSLAAESSIHNKYMESIRVNSKKSSMKSLFLSLLLGFSQFGQFFVFAAVFYAAAYWKDKYNLKMDEFFISLFALFFGVYGAGMANQFMGDLGKAKKASKK